MIRVQNLYKTYASGYQALRGVNLEIHRGEIFALLGPNGAGKTTLINIICGIVTPTKGTVLVEGHDIIRDYRVTRSRIGVMPQELFTDAFESVWDTVSFSRGLFGRPADPQYIEKILRELALWNKKDASIISLSGGMKRRVMIAKALAHEPRIVFLDEPTAGVDVELRRGMWKMVSRLREQGVTIVLTTHYLEEAQEMADRIGVIHRGELILVEEKKTLIKKFGKRQLVLTLKEALSTLPPALAAYSLELVNEGHGLVYTYDNQNSGANIATFLHKLNDLGLEFIDLKSSESSLEDIFVRLIHP